MSEGAAASTRYTKPATMEIRVEGHLAERWVDWFDGLRVTPTEDGDTLLTGSVPDQAALHGILKKVGKLGMAIVSVNRAETDDDHSN